MERSEWKSRVENYLQDKFGSDIQVTYWKELSGGACQDNIALDYKLNSRTESLVLRTDKAASLLSSLPKKSEFQVAETIYKSGALTPKPILYESNTEVLGNPFYLMERITGNANSRYLIKDNSLNQYRKKGMAQDLARNLAKIHTNTIENSHFDKDTLVLLGETNNELYIKSSIDKLKETINSLGEPHPAIAIAINWVESVIDQFKPTDICLVHGDFRTGNFMVTPEGLTGILDYEFAHWGDRHEDIGWLCMRDWRFGKVMKEVGGFADRKEFYDAYENASGVAVDPKKVCFWEIIGNLRWATGSIQQAERHLSGKDKGIELAAIGRRTCEMEFEMLNLIEKLEKLN
ncbi:phosphotransferase family protein [Leptospira sp. GIMC2001]|uniref:phosphotransferase family protein n=1 Tax=Leptospira sp. GIMC2001 TaxID=1513297 RepID=UPI00234B9FF0|nr:phosphotransferase family protein [Leptospira sp. GIMC2001]WCL49738.1 phosphotransferase family protein [Leptospira sp. GIMC2001]